MAKRRETCEENPGIPQKSGQGQKPRLATGIVVTVGLILQRQVIHINQTDLGSKSQCMLLGAMFWSLLSKNVVEGVYG